MPLAMPDMDDLTGALRGVQGAVHNWLVARDAPAAAWVPAPPVPVWTRPPGANGPLMTGKPAMTTGVGPQLLMTQPPKIDLLPLRNATLPGPLAPLAPKPPQLALRAGGMPAQGDGVGAMWTGAYDNDTPGSPLWIRDRALDATAQATQDRAVVRSDPGNFPDVRGTWAIPAPGRPRT